MVKNIGIHAIYPICLVYGTDGFPAKFLIFNGAFGAEWSISPLTAHIYITPIEKGPPSLPHLLYLCNLSNDRNIQNHTVICPNCLGEFLSIENGKEEMPEKEFMRSFQVALLLVQRCFQQDLHCNAMTSWSNCIIIAIQLNQ
jgi:hypothetical protein